MLTQSGNTTTGAVTISDFTVFVLPDVPIVGGPTITSGSCGVAPNYCVIGIFAANPNSGHQGFSYPHNAFSRRPSRLRRTRTRLDSPLETRGTAPMGLNPRRWYARGVAGHRSALARYGRLRWRLGAQSPAQATGCIANTDDSEGRRSGGWPP